MFVINLKRANLGSNAVEGLRDYETFAIDFVKVHNQAVTPERSWVKVKSLTL